MEGNKRRQAFARPALVKTMFKNIADDFKIYDCEFSRQGFWVMVPYRFGRWRYSIRSRWLRMPFSLVYRVLKLLSQILTGIDLPCEATVGRGFRIEHFGGIIISGDAVMGDDVVIRNGVTIGLKKIGEPGSPVIGNRVEVGAGAKILGRIHIGDDVQIGANAVVIRDVPPGHMAVGIPARNIPRKDLSTNRLQAAAEPVPFCAIPAVRLSQTQPCTQYAPVSSEAISDL
jgi:serine O-acetyltransferase